VLLEYFVDAIRDLDIETPKLFILNFKGIVIYRNNWQNTLLYLRIEVIWAAVSLGLAVETNKENNNKNKDNRTDSINNSLLSSRHKF
jgi:hypothetical protein